MSNTGKSYKEIWGHDNTVSKHTRAGKEGKNIFCPVCEWSVRVYNFAWSALVCHGCGLDIQKGEFLLSKSAKSTDIFFSSPTSEYQRQYNKTETAVRQPEEEERLSICCGADEDENIENMCSACHESTTFEVPHRNLDGSLGEMPPEPETPKTPTFKEAMTVAHEKIQKELTKVRIELETEAEKNAPWWPATERRLLKKLHTLEGKLYGLIYAESTFTLTQPEEINMA
jgi:hypothetical protein